MIIKYKQFDFIIDYHVDMVLITLRFLLRLGFFKARLTSSSVSSSELLPLDSVTNCPPNGILFKSKLSTSLSLPKDESCNCCFRLVIIIRRLDFTLVIHIILILVPLLMFNKLVGPICSWYCYLVDRKSINRRHFSQKRGVLEFFAFFDEKNVFQVAFFLFFAIFDLCICLTNFIGVNVKLILQ